MKFAQPSGDFYLTSLSATTVLEFAVVDRREFDVLTLNSTGGIQREPSAKRVAEIAGYCRTSDAAFPTPIILALPANSYELNSTEDEIEFVSSSRFASVVDGQHRILGLRESGVADRFELCVVILLEPTEEQKALVFATINGKQTRVPASLIFDLFGVTEGRSPQKTAHEVARALNSDPDSPWFRKLKMLGKQSTRESSESLTQGTFVRELLPHIASKPDVIFDLIRKKLPLPESDRAVLWKYFKDDDDRSIAKILLNMFNAQRAAWPSEWQSPKTSILTKTTGFMATMRAFDDLVRHGQEVRTLTQDHFERIFQIAKNLLGRDGMELSGHHFASSSTGINKLRGYFLEALDQEEKLDHLKR